MPDWLRQLGDFPVIGIGRLDALAAIIFVYTVARSIGNFGNLEIGISVARIGPKLFDHLSKGFIVARDITGIILGV